MTIRLSLFIFALSLSSCNKDVLPDIIPTSSIISKFDIFYGTQPSNKLDVFFRQGIPVKRPVVIYVFGGGWTSGDKNTWKQNHIQHFDSLGFVSVSMNYTLVSGNNGVTHPMQVNDVATALKWVYNNIGKYGGDKNRIFLMGASAGALLVDLVATDERILSRVGLPLSAIKGVISIDGGAYLTLEPRDYILPPENSPCTLR